MNIHVHNTVSMEFEHYSWRICVTAFCSIIYDVLLPRGMFLLIPNANWQRKKSNPLMTLPSI